MLTYWFKGRELATRSWFFEVTMLTGELEDKNSASRCCVLGAATLGLRCGICGVLEEVTTRGAELGVKDGVLTIGNVMGH